MFPEAPMIVRETSNGYFRYSIEEDMLSKREVECVGEITPESITETSVEELLYTAEMPPLDLIIRPSGEQRLSNFLIWQAAYAEFVFLDVLWPDFTKKHLELAIDEYNNRDRRFGGV